MFSEKCLGRFDLIFLLFSVDIIVSPGYQYPPVLTEQDLLTVQSPNYCANIFKNSVEEISVFFNSSMEITYVFRNVTDVNVFLFEVTGNKELRTLGKLKENSQNLFLDPPHGYFVLNTSTENPLALDRAGDKYQFKISIKNSQRAELRFEDKFEMFKFLVSKEGKERKVLSFDQSQILKKTTDEISNPQSVEEVECHPLGVERREPEGRADDQNNIVDVQREDAVVEYKSFSFTSMLEQEVQDLRTELDAKDVVIERQKIEKKMEKKYYELQDQMNKIGSIVASSCIHQEQEWQ